MTSKKKTTAKQTKKAVRNVQPAAKPADQPVVVQTSVFDCFCTGPQTTSEVVCVQVDGPVSVTHCVVGVVSSTATTVTNTVKKVAAKTVSILRSAWNWVTSKLNAGKVVAKAAAVRTKEYAKEKAAQVAIAVTLGFLYACAFTLKTWHRAKTFSVSTWNRAKANAITLYVSAKTNLIALRNSIRTSYASARAWTIRTWFQYKPIAVQVAKIAMVAAVLYVFASAVLISSCLIVATLGVHAYDQARLNLATQPARKRVPAKQRLQSPTLFGAI